MPGDAHHGNAQAPLAGVVLCSTAIPVEQRDEYAQIAVQMGATFKYDLTSDVTHLLIGSTDTPKYKYVAKERPDVVVVTSTWLEAVRESWMKGGDTDVGALEHEHRVPTFDGLKICLTGFDEMLQRQYIAETVQQHGAEYHGDLTKSVTHLIAATASGKKYEYAKIWKIKVVALEWLQQSVERGMALEEGYYDPRMPPEERGRGAWNRNANASVALGKRSRDTDLAKSDLDPNPRRKLRRAASSRLGGQNGSIWTEITAGGFSGKQTESDEWNAHVDDSHDNLLLDRGRVVQKVDANPGAAAQSEGPKNGRSTTTDMAPPLRGLSLRPRDRIFQGRVVFIHAFDDAKTSILVEHLSSHGAAVIRKSVDLNSESDDDLSQGYLIVPHELALTSVPDPPEPADKLIRVTEFWVEKCLHRKQLVDHSDVLCRPFSIIGIEGFDSMVINSTGFSGTDLLHVVKTVGLMGATYEETLTTQTSVVISNTPTPHKEKLTYARENNIPIVSTSWLRDCIESGEKLPFRKYILLACRAPQANKAPCPFVEEPTAPLSEEDKEKLRKTKQPSTADKPQGATKPAPKDKRPMKRANTLDLVASNPTPESAGHDESNDAEETPTFPFDASASAPLQELAPEVNSPRRPSIHSAHSNSTTNSSSKLTLAPEPAEQEPTPASVIPSKAQESLDSVIITLLAQKQAASAASAAQPTEPNSRRRKRGLLGRATSATSNPSTSASFSGPNSLDIEKLQQAVDEDEGGEQEQGQQDSIPKEYMPSQSLLYEDPSVQAAREKMIRKMGGTVDEVTGVVGPIGVVRDVVSEAVVGGRGAGRRRKL
ncbi:uncharacterized protein BDZ99DRAFT_501386 [Mytilinidion resinicola]|uniref:BRCT domain-containing protein n=1 Tax=Mytilinidion resinicola TaxID=574789 RepID=A0A6A6YCZ5_9PEZI|nr:uncharacterized protein BDZ99DRAFT_501386 [Mytilinidion resinicola]KAF2806580.1 hypothetical protein BDZ99DRAFT_501386 [Mytilinidion resinicola]